MLHIPVMSQEILQLFSYLNSKKNPVFADCTFGLGGHTQYLLERFDRLKIVGFEIDGSLLCSEQVSQMRERFADRLEIVNSSYLSLTDPLKDYRVDGILADLGVASPQIDDLNRGFSYSEGCKLDMRMSSSIDLTAEQIVNSASYEELKKIIYRNSEDRFAPLIARKIVELRKRKPIKSSSELVETVAEEFKGPRSRALKHVKCLFQALRIEVNGELDTLKKFLSKLPEENFLNDGIAAFITYHSIENRLVKTMLGKTMVIRPSYTEMTSNRRAASARIRYYRKVP